MNEADQDMKTKQIEDRTKNWIFTILPGANMVQKSANQGEIFRAVRSRWITPAEFCLILHILRKPNSLIALFFIQNNSQFKNIAKTFLPASMSSSSSIVYVQVCPARQIFSKQQMSPSELSSCCFCHVFSYYFAQFQLQFLLLQRVKCPPYFFHNQKNSTSCPGLLGNGVLTCSGLHFGSRILVKHKSLPNLVISNWLW